MPRVIGHRNFRLLLAARSASLFGTAMATIAVPFAVLEIGGSATEVGLVLAAFFVPQVTLLLLGGVVADRVPRQRLMVVADSVAAVAQSASAALLLTGALTIPAFAALQAVNGAASAFFHPASSALIPQTVPAEDLPAANALLRMFINGASIAGAAVGGLLAAVSVGGALAVDAATFAFSAISCALMAGIAKRPQRTPRMLAELREGWREFAGRRWLWVIVLQFGLVNACFDGALFVLGPVQAERHLGGASAWGLVMACFSAGLLVGALVSFRIRPRRPLLVAEIGVLMLALPLLCLTEPAPLALIAAAALVAGAGSEVFGVQWSLALQRHVPDAALARVSSYDALGSFALIPLGVAAAGPLADSIGIGATLIGATAVVLVATAAALAVRDVHGLPGEPSGA